MPRFFLFLIVFFVFFPAHAASIPISYGQTLTASIASPTAFNTHQFTAAAGDSVLIGLRNLSGGDAFDPQVVLKNAGGTELISGFNHSFVELTYKIVTAGNYIISVSDESSNDSGTYEITLVRLNNPAGAVAAAYHQTINGTLAKMTSQNMYKFNGQAADKVLVAFKSTTGHPLDPHIMLYDAAGNQLVDGWASSTSGTLSLTLPAAGSYTMRVYDDSYNATGNYQLTLERLNNPIGTAALAYHQTVTGTMVNLSSQNAHKFNGQAGDKIVVAMKSITGFPLDLNVALYDLAGNLVAGPTYGYNDITINQTLPAAGAYIIWIYDGGYDTTGTYQLTLERFNNPVSPGTLAYSTPKTISMPNVTSYLSYAFTATAADVVTIDCATTAVTEGSFNPMFQLRDVNGNPVGAPVEINGSIKVTVPATGTYYLWVFDLSYAGLGSFSMTLTLNIVKSVFISPVFITPSAGEKADITFELIRDSNVVMKIYPVNLHFLGELEKGPAEIIKNSSLYTRGVNTFAWDGRSALGTPLNSGAYGLSIEATSTAGLSFTYDPAYVPGGVTVTSSSMSTFSDPYKSQGIQINYSLAAPAFVTLQAGWPNVMPITREIMFNEPRFGDNTEIWDGRSNWGEIAPAGSYMVFAKTAVLPQNAIVLRNALAVSNIKIDPYAIYPIDGGVAHITYTVGAGSTVTVAVKNAENTAVVRTLLNGVAQSAGEHSVTWDGRDDSGKVVDTAGHYRASVTVADSTGNQKLLEGAITVFK